MEIYDNWFFSNQSKNALWSIPIDNCEEILDAAQFPPIESFPIIILTRILLQHSVDSFNLKQSQIEQTIYSITVRKLLASSRSDNVLSVQRKFIECR